MNTTCTHWYALDETNLTESYHFNIYLGCAPYYNTDIEEKTNTRMVRNFDGNDYQIYAKRFIPKV